MVKKNDLSADYGGKLIRALSHITVEPAVIGSLFVLFLYSMLGKQYIFLRLAQDYNLTQSSWETSCNETVAETNDPDYILFQRVSAETSQWIVYLSIATFVPATFSTVALGSWSDKFGRKLPMLISLSGFVLLIVCYVIVININAPVPYLIIGHVFCGFFGDSSTLLACSFSHVADITKPNERTFRITVIETCIGIGGFIASLSGGVWLYNKDFISPFWFLLALTIIDFFYIVIRLDSEDERWLENLKHLLSKEPFVHMYEVLKPQANDKNRHINIILYLTTFFLLLTATVGIGVILVVYEIGLPFCWSSIKVGISQSIVQAGYFLILALVKIFSGITAEVKLIIAGIISNSASCFLLAFAVDDWMIFFGLVVQMLYLMPSPILRSQMSRLVSTDETGPIFALQSCAANIATIAGSALFNGVFGATVDSSLPGAAFLLSPILLLLIFLPIYSASFIMASFATIRLVAVAIGACNFFIFILVFSIPFWRVTEVSASSEALANIWGHEGLWIECYSFYNKAAQCGQIGTTTDMGSSSSKRDSPYYMYGIYAYLGAYRTLMIIALVTAIGAITLSAVGMRCNKFTREGGRVKHWMNVAAGICHFVTGILTCVACSWYAALVMKEQSSPFYQTTRLKYTVGSCIYMGWISSAVSIALGCVLTCCTCFNRPVDAAQEWKPPIAEIEIPPQPLESVRMPSEKGYSHHDDWDHSESRYAASKKSHRSHRSHRSGRSGRSRSDSSSRWIDDDRYDDDRSHRYYDEKRSRHDDGFV